MDARRRASPARGERVNGAGARPPGGSEPALLGKAFGAVDDEFGASANLFVDAADVFAEDADADQLDATEEGDEHHEGGIAPDDLPTHKFVEQVDRHQQEREA